MHIERAAAHKRAGWFTLKKIKPALLRLIATLLILVVGITALPALPVAALGPGPVARWQFDEGVGTVALDTSAHNNHGMLVNDPTWQPAASCQVSGCLSFDGVNDFVQVPDSPFLDASAVSMGAWVKLDTVSDEAIISKDAECPDGSSNLTYGSGYRMTVDGGRIVVGVYRQDSPGPGSQIQFSSTGSISPGNWYHLAATIDSSAIKIYINGQLDSSSGTGVSSIHVNNEKLLIGAHQEWCGYTYSTYRFADGLIDEAQVFDRSVTASEVQGMYQAGSEAVSCSQTFGYIGALQTYTVPTSVTQVIVDAYGAQGGTGNGGVSGGRGGRTSTTLAVVSGETLWISAGQIGSGTSTSGGVGTFGGGGATTVAAGTGGGASDVRRGGNGLAQRILVAGGGGGAGRGESGSPGGAGGYPAGAKGSNSVDGTGDEGGYGGTQSAGGAPGTAGSSYVGTAATAGTLGLGGNGGAGSGSWREYYGGGGGGGGYYGGGGGKGGSGYQSPTSYADGAGGGGGSSFGPAGSQFVSGANTGNGRVVITAQDFECPIPVGNWKFDESSGTTAPDSSSNNNHGTLVNGPAWQPEGSCKVARCLSFDGTNDFVQVPDSPSLDVSAVSMGAWVKLDTVSDEAIISKDAECPDGSSNGTYGSGYRMTVDGGRVAVRVYAQNAPGPSSAIQLSSIGSVSPGNWYHLAATIDSSAIKIYINGQLDSLSATGVSSIHVNNEKLLIGAHQEWCGYTYSTYRFADGLIDEAQVFNRALTGSEIQSVYLAANGAPTTPTMISPADGATFAENQPQTFIINATDPESDPYEAAVTIRNAETGALIASFFTSQAPSGMDSAGAPIPQLPPGSYTWSARAKDSKGAESSNSASRAFAVVTNQAPSAPAAVSPVNGAVFSSTDLQAFTINATDPDDDPYTGTITITNTAVTGTVVTVNTSAAPSGQNSAGSPTPQLSPGNYTWTAKAKDAKGAEGPASISRAFSVSPPPANNPPQTPALISPAGNAVFGSTDPQVFTINANDPESDPYFGVITIRNASDGSVAATFDTAVAFSGQHSSGGPVPQLPPDSYTFTAHATDAKGASSPESASQSFSVATLPSNGPPSAPTLVSPADGQVFMQSGTQTFIVNTTDPQTDDYMGVVTVTNTATGAVVSLATAPASSGQNASTPSVKLPPGSYTWTAKAIDTKGAESASSATRSFTVSDNSSPATPTLVSPTDQKVFSSSETQLFTVNASDPESDPYTGTVTVMDTATGQSTSLTTTASLSGQDSTGAPAPQFPPGSYTWTAKAKDVKGLESPPSPARAFRVIPPANAPPSITSASDSPDPVTYGATINFSVGWSDPGDLVRAVVCKTNAVSDATCPGGAWGIGNLSDGSPSGVSYITSPADAGTQNYYAFACDDENACSSSIVGTFTVVNEPPSITSASDSPDPVVYGANINFSVEWNDSGDSVRAVVCKTNLISAGSCTGGAWAVGNFSVSSPSTASYTTTAADAGTQNYYAFACDDENACSSSIAGTFTVLLEVGRPDSLPGLRLWHKADSITGKIDGDPVSQWDDSSGNVLHATQPISSKQPTYRAVAANGKPLVRFDGTDDRLSTMSSSSLTLGKADFTMGTVLQFTSTGFATPFAVRNSANSQIQGLFTVNRSGPDGRVEFETWAWTDTATRAFSADALNDGRPHLVLVIYTASDNTVRLYVDGNLADTKAQGTLNPDTSVPYAAYIGSNYGDIQYFPGDIGETIFYDRALTNQQRMSLENHLKSKYGISGMMATPGSDAIGLEEFYPYQDFSLGTGSAFANMATGNLVLQYTDFDVPGQGLNMRLTRTYNVQRDDRTGPLGRGWTLGVLGTSTSGVPSAGESFDLYDADGTRHRFVKDPSLGWRSPPGVNLVLSDAIDAQGQRWYAATRPDGVVYEFHPDDYGYHLTKISDRKGNYLTFSYSSGNLSTITDTTGRTISFTWSGAYLDYATYSAGGSSYTVDYTVNSSGRLTLVTDASGTSSARTNSYTYGDYGLTGVTDPRGAATSFSVTNGQLTQVTDRAGKAWRLLYNDPASCQPSTMGAVAICLIDPESATSVWTTSSAKLIDYRDQGDVNESGLPRNNRRQYQWMNNRLTRQVDEAGNVREYDYNSNGQITQVRSTGVGEPTVVSSFTYAQVSPGVADLTDAKLAFGTAEQRDWHFVYDASGNLTSTTDPETKTTAFTYYERGLLKTLTDANTKTTTYGNIALTDGGYHPSGQPAKITDPTGAYKSFVFDFLGRMTQMTDRNNKVWSYDYDLRGNPTKQTDPLGRFVLHCFDSNDNEVLLIRPKASSPTCSFTEANPYTNRKTYDSRDLLSSVLTKSDSQLRKTVYNYYDDGQLKEILEPRSFNDSGTQFASVQKATYSRYPNNRVSAFIDEVGAQTDVIYTSDGQPRIVTDPPGSAGRHTTTYTYAGFAKPKTVLESSHSLPTTYAYNLHGEKTSQTTPKGTATLLFYDKMGRLTRTLYPNGRDTLQTYDPVGNLVSISQPRGNSGYLTTSYIYTSRNQIQIETDPADSSHTIEYAYDPEAHQTYKYDKYNGSAERTMQQIYYDDGRLSQKIASGSGLSTHSANFYYDADGNTNLINTYKDGTIISGFSIDHTTADEVKTWNETIIPTGGSGVAQASSFTYTRDSLLASRTYGGSTKTYSYLKNGLELNTFFGDTNGTSSEYYPNGALKHLGLPVASLDVAYDTADRVRSWTYKRPDGLTLTSFTNIAYDDNDNRTYEDVSQIQTDGTNYLGNGEYRYDNLDRLNYYKHPFEVGKTYQLDDSGNLTNDGEYGYLYTNNRLMNRTNPGGPYWVSSHYYDHFGNQNRMQTPSGDTTTTYDAASHSQRVTAPDGSYVDYGYDGLDRMIWRKDSTTGATTIFFHDRTTDQILIETDAAGATQTKYLLDSDGDPIANETTGVGRAYYVNDTRGNLIQMLDPNRNVVAIFGYDAFGKPRDWLTRTTANWDSRLRFQTAPRDPKTGAYSLGTRLYDPAINRFIGVDNYVGAAANMQLQLDPLTGNRYLYAGCNPVGMIDDGHKPCKSTKQIQKMKPANDLERLIQRLYIIENVDERAGLGNDDFIRDAARLISGFDAGSLPLGPGWPGGPRVGAPPNTIEGSIGWNPSLVDDNRPARHAVGWLATGYFHPRAARAQLAWAERPGRIGASQPDYLLSRIVIDLGRALRRGRVNRCQLIQQLQARLKA